MEKRIICIGGPLASGKDVLGNIAKSYGFATIGTSQIISSWLPKDLHSPQRKDYIDAIEYKSLCTNPTCEYEDSPLVIGSGIMGTEVAKQIVSLTNNKLMVIGIRSPYQILELRKTYPLTTLIYVEADINTRLHRALLRKKSIDQNNIETLMKQELEDSISMSLSKTKRLADMVITNNSTLELFSMKAHSTLLEITRHHHGKTATHAT